LKIALGSAQFGLDYGIANINGKVNSENVNKILTYADKIGIDTIDTAASYGNSEESIGRNTSLNFKLITKLNPIPTSTDSVEKWANKELEKSLRKLNKKNIYGILLHRPNELLSCYGNDLFKALKDFKKRGMVKKIGISIYSPNELDDLMEKFEFDIVQCPLNLIDSRLVTSGWLERLKKNNIEIHTRSCFLQGLLLMKKKDIPQKFMTWNHIWQKWHNWLLLKNISPVEACLAYPLSFSEINRVIVGVDSKSHLNEIISVANKLKVDSFPEIGSSDQNLINPAKWDKL
jgi:aryl-alcohol dehydrogenase-like predicted oxidoreductase